MRRLLFAAIALTGIPLAVAWIVSEQVMHPRRRVEDNNLSNMPLPAEDVEFVSSDGTSISGWFIPPLGLTPAPGIVLSHGWARSRCELLPHAQFLHRAGFAVLMFDYRHRGSSGGESITMGVHERGDLLAAIDLIEARPEVDRSRIAVLGMSTGGVIAIVVGAEDSRVRAIAAEGPFASFETVLDRSLRHYSKLPLWPFAAAVRWMLERRFGGPLRDAEAERYVARFAPRPIFIIGDENDQVVGVQDSRVLFDLAGDPKRYWLIEQSDHARGWQFASAEYERRVIAFFKEALASENPVAEAPSATRG